MASTKFLIVAAILVTGAHSKFVWTDDEQDGFPRMPSFRFPDFPSLPRFSRSPESFELRSLEFPEFKPVSPLEFPKIKFREFKPLEFPKMKFRNFPEMKMPKFEPITFKPIEPIDPEKVATYEPRQGENYVATVVSSHSISQTVNGKTVRTGGSSVLVNNNGEVKREGTVFNAGDTFGKKE